MLCLCFLIGYCQAREHYELFPMYVCLVSRSPAELLLVFKVSWNSGTSYANNHNISKKSQCVVPPTHCLLLFFLVLLNWQWPQAECWIMGWLFFSLNCNDNNLDILTLTVISEGSGVVQWVNTCAGLTEDSHVSSQLCVTPTPGHPKPCSGRRGHLHSHLHIIYTESERNSSQVIYPLWGDRCWAHSLV